MRAARFLAGLPAWGFRVRRPARAAPLVARAQARRLVPWQAGQAQAEGRTRQAERPGKGAPALARPWQAAVQATALRARQPSPVVSAAGSAPRALRRPETRQARTSVDHAVSPMVAAWARARTGRQAASPERPIPRRMPRSAGVRSGPVRVLPARSGLPQIPRHQGMAGLASGGGKNPMAAPSAVRGGARPRAVAPVAVATARPRLAAPGEPMHRPAPAVPLDGAPLGRWLADQLADAVLRPPSGISAMDERLTPVFPGTTTG